MRSHNRSPAINLTMKTYREGSSPRALNEGRSIAFEPNWIEVTRIEPFCQELACLMNEESFQMTLGDSQAGLPHCMLSIEFNRSVPLGDPVRLQVQPASAAVSGHPGDGTAPLVIQKAHRRNVDFTFLRGAHASNPSDFDAVAITFLTIPVACGDPLAVHIDVHFVDGRTLARTFRGPLVADSLRGG